MTILNKLAYHACMATLMVLFCIILGSTLLLTMMIMDMPAANVIKIVFIVFEIIIISTVTSYFMEEYFDKIDNFFKKICRVKD